MERTRTRTVDGALATDRGLYSEKITVRVTKDEIGETVSFSSNRLMLQFSVPLEELHDMLKVVPS